MLDFIDQIHDKGCIYRGWSEKNEEYNKEFNMLYGLKNKHIDSVVAQLLPRWVHSERTADPSSESDISYGNCE